MMTRCSALARCMALLGLSLAAAVAVVLIQPAIRPPRWDLLSCLVVAAIAAGVGVLLLRRSASGGRETAGRHWWVEQRNSWVGFAVWSWAALAFFVAYAALSPTAAAWEIVDAGSAMRTTEIEEVVSSKYVSSQRTGHYTSTVLVSVPFDQGPRITEVALTSGDKPTPGEEVWVLFAPSSPELGVFVGDRQSLEEEVGGRADLWTVFLAIGWLAFCWFMNLFGRWRSDPVAGLHRSKQQGSLHELPIVVAGVGVAIDERPASASSRKHLKPRIRMTSTGFGELYFYLDDIVDPVPLAQELVGVRGRVFWRPPTRQLPYADSVGYAVVLLDGQRYLCGWLESPDASVPLPTSALVPSHRELPIAGEPRALRPTSRVVTNANSVILQSVLVALVPLAVITFGVSDVAAVALAVASGLAVVRGRRRAAGLVRRHLQRLEPDGDPSAAVTRPA